MRDQIIDQIKSVVRRLFDVDSQPVLTRPDAQFGDYSTNVAMQIAKRIASPPAGGPRAIAEQIVANLQTDKIAKAEVAGPGFINVWLTDEELMSGINEANEDIDTKAHSIVIETNNPNPFKAMHIGHAFNAILGDTLANLLEAAGNNVYRVSYHGDVGLHVGKSMYSLLNFVNGDPTKLNDISPGERNSFMSKMYTNGSKAYKEDETAKYQIEDLAKQSFSREDPIYAQVYDSCREWSLELIDQTILRLGNKRVERKFFESDAELRGVKIVRDNTPGVFKESDGALVFPGSQHGSFDNVFVSNRGSGLYGARDLGLIQLKNEQYHPDKSYIVTAEEQRAYFKGVIAAAELCMPDQKDVTVNIPHGTVKLSTGKMSSRDGDVLEIAWLFEQIADAIRQQDGEVNDQMIAAVLRYQFLRVRIGVDVVFDVNESVSVNGNSGPYLQYAHARARSILAKADPIQGVSLDGQLTDGERLLARKLGEYHEVIELAIKELMPHHICNYLYELAQEFNRFYEKNRVIGDERQAIRLGLVQIYSDTLRKGLGLLGIHAPERM